MVEGEGADASYCYGQNIRAESMYYWSVKCKKVCLQNCCTKLTSHYTVALRSSSCVVIAIEQQAHSVFIQLYRITVVPLQSL